MFELNEKQKNKLKEIAKKYQLELVLLFGSRAEGTNRKGSDYDIAYLSKSSFIDYQNQKTNINMALSNFFEKKDLRFFDIEVDNPLLLKKVFDNPQVLYISNEECYRLCENYALKIYADYQWAIR
ncbi:nucleotidyltransferase domain-containing protein [Candidatus Gribaldobacteria bacterium]|nr:nucleotidyltransferase domain-containing protein [Candidatus Gribaldobacteria bacterium]